MLIATITTLVLVFGMGGATAYYDAWFDDMSSALAEHIPDEERASASAAIIQQMRDQTAATMERVAEQRRRLLLVDGNPDATAEDYHRVFGELIDTWLASERRVLDLRFQLVDKVSREEWDAAFTDLREHIPWSKK